MHHPCPAAEDILARSVEMPRRAASLSQRGKVFRIND
jgi:hypothetical protein